MTSEERLARQLCLKAGINPDDLATTDVPCFLPALGLNISLVRLENAKPAWCFFLVPARDAIVLAREEVQDNGITF